MHGCYVSSLYLILASSSRSCSNFLFFSSKINSLMVSSSSFLLRGSRGLNCSGGYKYDTIALITHAYTHTQTHTHTHAHTGTHACMCVHTQTHKRMHIQINTRHIQIHTRHRQPYRSMHPRTYTHTHTHAHAHTCPHMHAHACTHIHTHTHAHKDKDTHTHKDKDIHIDILDQYLAYFQHLLN